MHRSIIASNANKIELLQVGFEACHKIIGAFLMNWNVRNVTVRPQQSCSIVPFPRIGRPLPYQKLVAASNTCCLKNKSGLVQCR